MTLKLGFDGFASAELTRMLQGIENGLNFHKVALLVQGDERTDIEVPSGKVPCDPRIDRHCKVVRGPIEPLDVIALSVVTSVITAFVVVLALYAAFNAGRRSALGETRTRTM